MAEAKPQSEPSMEEILASIRRIISEDEAAPAAPAAPSAAKAAAPAPQPVAAAAAPARPAPAPAPVAVRSAPAIQPQEEEEEVLDLTERVSDDGTVVNLHADAARRAPPAQPEEIELREVPPPPAPAPAAPPEPAATDLVAAAAAAATTASFAALARAVDRNSASDPVSVGGRSLEDIVKEIMRPMIRDWLDANLPALVEKLVRREIERLSHKGQDQ
jgi:cell pole-organizing protein PopZ